VTKYIEDSSNFGADGPFFRIIREGLQGLADGEDYFDLLADDVVFEYVISVPGYPKRVEGRQNIIDLYSDYDSFMAVGRAPRRGVNRRSRSALDAHAVCHFMIANDTPSALSSSPTG
jgi:hypothetical protein